MKREVLKSNALITMLFIGMMAVTGITTAQQAPPPPDNRGGKSDKIEALRIAFISQKLNLTPEEAEKFWPVYNSYRQDMEQLRKSYKLGPGNPPLTADQQLSFEQKKLDLKVKYKDRYEAALGPDKVNILYNLENEFRQKLKEIHDQRQKQHRQGPPPPRR